MDRIRRFMLAIMTIGVLCAGVQAQNYQGQQPSSQPVIANGTELQVRINQALSSDKAQVGERFQGVLVNAVYVNSTTSFPPGSIADGRIISIKESGRLSNPGEMELVVHMIHSGTMSALVNVNPFTAKGASHTGSNVGKTAAGAGIGAVIGAIAGGGKGAAIGAGAGGAAGTGAAAATGKKPAKIEPETILRFVLATDAPVDGLTAAGGNATSTP